MYPGVYSFFISRVLSLRILLTFDTQIPAFVTLLVKAIRYFLTDKLTSAKSRTACLQAVAITFWQRPHFDDFAWKCALVFGAAAAVIGLGGLVACAQVASFSASGLLKTERLWNPSSHHFYRRQLQSHESKHESWGLKLKDGRRYASSRLANVCKKKCSVSSRC